MKVGDKFPVQLAGHTVVEATVTLMEEGIATLEFPGQRVKMSYVTQLAPDLAAPVETPSKQVIIDGVDRVESAPVGATEPVTVDDAQQVTEQVQTVAPEAPESPVEAVEKPAAPEEATN